MHVMKRALAAAVVQRSAKNLTVINNGVRHAQWQHLIHVPGVGSRQTSAHPKQCSVRALPIHASTRSCDKAQSQFLQWGPKYANHWRSI
eukprot:1149313-Pelagomonas_calceolata.AAC.2